MIDRQFIGHTMPAFEVLVEKGRLRFFAKATGQTDPVYTDEAAARAAGHASKTSTTKRAAHSNSSSAKPASATSVASMWPTCAP